MEWFKYTTTAVITAAASLFAAVLGFWLRDRISQRKHKAEIVKIDQEHKADMAKILQDHAESIIKENRELRRDLDDQGRIVQQTQEGLCRSAKLQLKMAEELSRVKHKAEQEAKELKVLEEKCQENLQATVSELRDTRNELERVRATATQGVLTAKQAVKEIKKIEEQVTEVGSQIAVIKQEAKVIKEEKDIKDASDAVKDAARDAKDAARDVRDAVRDAKESK